ncbi:DUF3455 domain-containing protein [Nostoc sp. C117]|uniref:DUF3455 domain-containing protein n=1 Tax=Nostoc sp. C117 TaxID=3349875 RepID=UPI00370D6509
MLKFGKNRQENSNEWQASPPPLSPILNLILQSSIALLAFMALVFPATALPEDNKNGQPIQPPYVPDNLRVPKDQVLLLKTLGSGVQIYDCKATATDPNTFIWTFRQPLANIFGGGGNKNQVGIHGRGPFWASYDGSRITGSVKASLPSPDPLKNIPLLLLNATSNGSDGIFSHVNFVQRLDTKGGVAPIGACNPNRTPSIAVPYSAFYYFYGNSP